MRTDDPRNLADLPGPWNLKQEIEAVDNVGFDLGALVRAEAPLWYGKIADFFRSEHGPLDSTRVLIGLPGDFEKAVEFSLGKDRRLVGLKDSFESSFHLGPAETVFVFERRDARQGFGPVQFQEEAHLFALHADFHLLVEIVKAVRNEVDLHRIELLGLDQDILAHADFSEIVQQRRVTDLLHLFGRKANRRVRPCVDTVHDFRQPDGHVRNPQGMAGGRWIALLNRLNGSLDEAFEQLFNVLVQAAIFVG